MRRFHLPPPPKGMGKTQAISLVNKERSKMTMRLKTTNLLLEAFRRWLCFQENKSLTEAWTGLGFPSEYREIIAEGYMEWVSKPQPRCQGWLRLTPKGVEALRKLLKDKYAPNFTLVN